MMRILLITLLAAFIVGCTTPNHQLLDNAQQVHIRMDSGFDATQCEWLGEATGTEGSWYSSWLYPNDILIAGAISDLKNRAYQLGGDTIFVAVPHHFQTSVTLFGSVYRCY
ncbi:DUF4156 domain-containing protein [Vibrio aestuarianus]|nr:DUF4156 domain-containing protein [Vibrio aestuarianus]CAH8201519.1 conserved hypothetical protein [Vibrio aestuarianus]CAH8203010.1 conserved hypothetical protein [Vibrio aestuarianus]CAH8203806.1 conserved hypothetical protein [Vibrio aestuarianus]